MVKSIKYKFFQFLIITTIILFIGAKITHATGQSSASYIIEIDEIDGGSEDGSSASYLSSHSIGQPRSSPCALTRPPNNRHCCVAQGSP